MKRFLVSFVLSFALFTALTVAKADSSPVEVQHPQQVQHSFNTTSTTVSLPVVTTTTVKRTEVYANRRTDSECPYAAEIHAAFDPVGRGDHMVAIAMRESRCLPTAVNPRIVGGNQAKGIFQLMLPMHNGFFTDPSQWDNPYENILAAKRLYDYCIARSMPDPWAY